MSRSRFLTQTNTGTPAASSGCNGFIIPFTYTSPGALVAVDRQKLAGWWRRIKNWNLVSTWSITNSAAEVCTFPNGPMLGSAAADEIDTLRSGFTPGTSVQATPVGRGLLAIYPFGEAPKIISDSGLLYPDFNVGSTSVLGDPTVGGENVRFSATDFSPSDGSFNIMVEGVSRTIFYKSDTIPPTVVPGTFTFTPIEYWSFSGIYNTSTGAVNPGMSPTM